MANFIFTEKAMEQYIYSSKKSNLTIALENVFSVQLLFGKLTQ